MSNWTPAKKLIKARIDFIHQDCVFLGNLSLRLKLVPAYWLPTAGTDGFHFYYNPDFIDKLTLPETKFVVAHEVMHCVYEHMLRRNGRDPRVWNMAGDYRINLELKDMSIGRIPTNEKFLNPEFKKKMPEKAKEIGAEPMCLLDEKYRGMFSEQIYDLIKEDEENGRGGEHGDSFDVHIDPNGQGGDGDGDGEGGQAGGDGSKGPIKVSQEDLDRLPDEIRKAVLDAAAVAESVGGGAGNVPAGVKRLIDEWTDSQMDWREYLNNVIQSTLKSDYTWQRPSRKSWSSGCYLPGMDNDDMVSVDIAIDTSGSMTEQMLKDILGEVKGIMEQFQDFRMRVWCFDTQAYKVHTYGPDTVDELEDFELTGFGGTDFECNWTMMREKDIVPDQLIVCTDGYPYGSWGDEDYCDTVFLIHGEGAKGNVEAPFGTTVYYEEAKATA